MNRTLADTLQTLSEYFPKSLVSPLGFDNLIQTAKYFPSLVSPVTAFESRLDENEPFLDMFFSVEKTNKAMLMGEDDALRFDDELYTHSVWKNTRQLGKEWCIPDSLLDEYLDRLFLEFDVGQIVSELPVPALFLQISEKMFRMKGPDSLSKWKKLGLSDYQWVFDALSILKGRSVDTKALAITADCFEKLLPETHIDHAAIMASRSPDVIRLNITNLNEELLFEYLERININFPLIRLQKSLSDLFRFVDHMVLALDIGNQIYPKIGIEFQMPKEKLDLAKQNRWIPFLDFLVDRKFCTKAKREGLIQWIGRSREIYDPDLYPFQVYRYINLIKAVFEPDTPPRFKGYFSFTY